MKKLVIVLLFAAVIFTTYKTYEMKNVEKSLSQKIIRFHVRANSNSEADQAVKLVIKDRVVDYLYDSLAQSESLEMTRSILEEKTPEIIDVAKATLAEYGMDYSVKVYFENTYFPLKTYGDMTFPPGNYEAFRIDIGAAGGKNWWCVMYPPLCFVDCTYAVVPESSKEKFREILTTKEYDAITMKEGKNANVKYTFKILETFK